MNELPASCRFLIVGAGVAGVSAAYELAHAEPELGADVVVAEMEAHPGTHTTGRSAAMFIESYGNPTVRGLTGASRAFFEEPPDGFSEAPLLTPRGALYVAGPDGEAGAALDELMADPVCAAYMRRVEAQEALDLSPSLSADAVERGAFEEAARDIDVDALMQGYIRGFRAAGGRLVTDAEVRAMTPLENVWRVDTKQGAIEAEVIVDAAGAWADHIAGLAGLESVGLVPKRRTAITFDPGRDVSEWPITVDAAETWYFRPEGGGLLVSPADETPSPPCDAQPEELDVAIAIDRFERVSTLRVGRVASKRAGLRTFAADKTHVIGYDASRPNGPGGFFWLAGQGGYGIQTAPAAARAAAALALGRGLPDDVAARGVSEAGLAPGRFG